MNYLKNLNKKKINFSIIFLTIFILFLFFPVQYLLATDEPKRPPLEFVPQIKIPTLDDVVTVTGQSIGGYIAAFYQWFVIFIAVLAVIVIMISGLRWIFAAGNPQAIKQSQDQFFAALIGLLLILIAVPVLQMINPRLVDFTALEIPWIRPIISLADEVPLKVWVVPRTLGRASMAFRAHVAKNLDMYDNLPTATHFCLFPQASNAKPDNFCGYHDSVPTGWQWHLNRENYTGSCTSVGGLRSVVFIAFFPGNYDPKDVAVRGSWGIKGGITIGQLCENSVKKEGCGHNEHGWHIDIRKKIDREVCKENGFETGVCNVVIGWGPANIGWKTGEMENYSKKKGEFEVRVEIISRKDHFSDRTTKIYFNQTCGIIDDCTVNTVCCKRKVHPDGLNYPNIFYYDFDCPPSRLGSTCDYFGEGWELVDERYAKDFCNIP